MTDVNWRHERDALGDVKVRADRLYGAQTQRAVDNFPISGLAIPRPVIAALAHIKYSAVHANGAMGLLDPKLVRAIQNAATEVIEGRHDDQFPVDVFQTGSGTSTNMNMNEVLANRASQILGGQIGAKHPVHPNDHVNLGQSSNDVFPTAIQIATIQSLDARLFPALDVLIGTLEDKAKAWRDVVTMGRTHLMDAMPVRLGDVFGGYAAMLRTGRNRLATTREELLRVPLGGTAVGTGYGTTKVFVDRVLADLSQRLSLALTPAQDSFQALSAPQSILTCSADLRLLAIDLTKIANDVRWLGSGPRAGLAELKLPPVQPGSSIMPGKVNPVMSEMLLMVCGQVVGLDAAVAWCGAGAGNFQLNTALPLLGWNIDHAIGILAQAVLAFARRCVIGLDVDRDRCRQAVESSLALATALAPALGYDRAAAIAQQAHAEGQSIRDTAGRLGVLDPSDLDKALDPMSISASLSRK